MDDLPEAVEWGLNTIPKEQVFFGIERFKALPPAVQQRVETYFAKLRTVAEGLTREEIVAQLEELERRAGLR